jgi:uncharacterized NAD(P)/FAD-binding protein YdhS
MKRDIAIVGGGAAGALVLAHVARVAARSHTMLRALVIDAGPGGFGQGVAYRTGDGSHLLNVRASSMSAHHDRPDHFVRWLRDTGHRAGPDDFVPRRDYGAYLASVLRDAAATTMVQAEFVRGRVDALDPKPPGWLVFTDTGRSYPAEHVVLAVGAHRPSVAWAPPHLLASPRFVADPWAPSALDQIGDAGPVLLVGTGLTMVDVALSLDRPERVLVALSRHGRLPHPHAEAPLPTLAPDALPEPVTLDAVRVWMRDRVRTATRHHADWRPAVDGVRPVTARIWAALSEADRREFLERDVRSWEVARHRMATEPARRIEHLRGAARLRVLAGGVVGASLRPDGVRVELAGGTAVDATWVVNCAGAEPDLRRTGDPLLHSLFAAGVVVPGPLDIGLDTDDAGRVRDAAGAPNSRLWTLGGTRRGTLWESTAIPEIRTQAYDLADRLVADIAAGRGSTVGPG